jgi:hypothetical protein
MVFTVSAPLLSQLSTSRRCSRCWVLRLWRVVQVFDAYCAKTGLARDELRFLFDCQRIDPTSTFAEWELQDGDVIEVMMEQKGD